MSASIHHPEIFLHASSLPSSEQRPEDSARQCRCRVMTWASAWKQRYKSLVVVDNNIKSVNSPQMKPGHLKMTKKDDQREQSFNIQLFHEQSMLRGHQQRSLPMQQSIIKPAKCASDHFVAQQKEISTALAVFHVKQHPFLYAHQPHKDTSQGSLKTCD